MTATTGGEDASTSSGKFPAPAPGGGWSLARRLLPLLVLALTFLVYSGTLGFEFVYDDRSQIVQNLVVQSWRFLPRYFTSHVWSYAWPGNVANYYRPVFLMWLRINHALFGLQPAGWHLTSVMAHLVVTLEVYWLGLRILADRPAAIFASLLFGLHPAHTESVAWVSGVTDPLFAGLFMGAFLCYLNSRQLASKKRLWLLMSCLLYALAMLAKETAVVLPGVIFFYEWIWSREKPGKTGWGPMTKRFWAGVLRAAPYLALTALYMPARVKALGGFGHVMTPLPLTTVIFTWPSLLWIYIKLLIWPVGLSPFYDIPYVPKAGLIEFWLPALGVIVVAALFWVWGHNAKAAGSEELLQESRAVAFFSLWMVLALLPLVDLSVLPKGELVKDRYLYLPSVGFVVLAALGWRHIRFGSAQVFRLPLSRLTTAVVAACLLGLLTFKQSAYWANNLVLYTRGVSVAPHDPNARVDLANAACDRGYYDAGLKLYKQVIHDNPDFWLAYHNLGFTCLELGKLDDADRYLSRSLELNGVAASGYYYLGITRYREGQWDNAAALIRRALEIRPDGPGYHLALGMVLEQKGDLKEALEEFKQELASNSQAREALPHIARLEKLLSAAPVR